jgi:hypothetical protein
MSQGPEGSIIEESDAHAINAPVAKVSIEDEDRGNGQILTLIRNPYPSNHVYVEFTGRCSGKVVILPGHSLRVCVRATGESANLRVSVAERDPD